MIRKDEKTAVIEANRTHPTDTGSPEVQIAILTAPFQRGAVASSGLRPARRRKPKEGPQGARMGFAGVGGLRTASRAGAA